MNCIFGNLFIKIVAADNLLEMLKKSLQVRGISIVDVLARSQRIGAEVLAKEFNLLPEERTQLFQALQLRAQAAVEEIRSASETELSDEDIEAVIQEVRTKA